MKTLPSWLTAKNLYIAENLVNQGFHYCGHSDNFCEGYYLEGMEDWDLYFSYGEIGLEAICDKAFFFCDLESSQSTLEEILDHAKKLISLFSYEWDHSSPHHQQLELFAA